LPHFEAKLLALNSSLFSNQALEKEKPFFSFEVILYVCVSSDLWGKNDLAYFGFLETCAL
jgi:hypothetical protein